MADPERDHFDSRLTQLIHEQQPYLAVLKDLRDYQAPYRGNFEGDEGKKGQRMDTKVFNGTPGMAARVLQAGMNAGITSPARPWFRLAASNPELMERADVRLYLNTVEEKLYRIFSVSNFYDMASILYQEISIFGTASMAVEEDFEDVARFHTYTIGEYFIATNARGVVDVIYRKIRKTASQLVEDFGIENVSSAVANQYSNKNTEVWATIIHAVEPNDDRVPNMLDAKNMAFRSVYYEEGSTEKKFLRVSGFPEFPNLCPRWSITGSGAYGTDQPGLVALGDSKQLQSEQFMKAEGIVKNVKPPLQAPSDLKIGRLMNIPGGVTYFNPYAAGANQGVKPLYEVRIPLADIIQDIRDIEGRINNAFYVNLFLSIISNNRPEDMKAEVAFQMDKERLLMLGPVLERLNNEWLNPLIDRVFRLADDAGVLPEAPAILEGENLKVEYVSALAKAQKAVAISNMERLSGLTGAWAQFDPNVVDKLDFDQGVDEAAELLDVPTKFVRSDEEADEVRKGRAQIENQKAALEASQSAASTAKDLANAPVGTGNILEQLVGAP